MEREDNIHVSDPWVCRFPVANGSVEVCLQVCGAGLESAYLPFRSFRRRTVRPAYPCVLDNLMVILLGLWIK
jgi:hypothetical protein